MTNIDRLLWLCCFIVLYWDKWICLIEPYMWKFWRVLRIEKTKTNIISTPRLKLQVWRSWILSLILCYGPLMCIKTAQTFYYWINYFQDIFSNNHNFYIIALKFLLKLWFKVKAYLKVLPPLGFNSSQHSHNLPIKLVISVMWPNQSSA